ncbi:MAG: site-2 protease family protein [Phycisphaerae bacterium]|nr:site-2 protease family protein [Phycisphaerae bacterium]
MPELPMALGLPAVNSLTIAVLLAWILSVTLHEFGHALAAYLGGDRTVRERGYLTLDPLRFIDPVMTLLIPAVILLLGGLPLPGAAVPIDTSRLRNRRWEAIVAAAGPAANMVIFLGIMVALHPAIGLVDTSGDELPRWALFLGALGFLQFYAILFNLIPLPPLDGFGIIEHTLDPKTRWKLRQPHVSMACLTILFMLVWTFPPITNLFVRTFISVVIRLNGDPSVFIEGYTAAFHG